MTATADILADHLTNPLVDTTPASASPFGQQNAGQAAYTANQEVNGADRGALPAPVAGNATTADAQAGQAAGQSAYAANAQQNPSAPTVPQRNQLGSLLQGISNAGSTLAGQPVAAPNYVQQMQQQKLTALQNNVQQALNNRFKR